MATSTPSSADQPIQLTHLSPGTAARFHASELEAQDIALLEALGMKKSCRFRLCQAGDPWIVQVRETRIGLASAVASRIFVIPET